MLLLFQFPENFDPRTWPAGWLVIGVVAFFWLIKQVAEALGSIKAIHENGAGIKDWFKGLFITPRQQAARERKELKEAVQTLGGAVETVSNTCGDLGLKVDEIYREVKPNGGKSMRDDLTAIGAWIRHQKETSETPIFILDANGNMTFANAAFREMVHAEEAELMDRKFLSRIESADQKRLIEVIEVAIKNQIPFDEVVHFKQDGPHFIPIRLQAMADSSEHHSLKNFFGTASKVESPDQIHASQA